MKLLELVSMLSEVPMRVNSLSTTLTDANLAGTALPICAMMTIKATCVSCVTVAVSNNEKRQL